MYTINENKMKFWRQHFTASESHVGGAIGYCKEQKLCVQTYYRSKKRIEIFDSSESEAKGSFLPIQIKENKNRELREIEVPCEASACRSVDLPNARWVAEVLMHLAAGAR